MSASEILLTIVTDNARRAAPEFLAFDVEIAPAWAHFATDIIDVQQIPHGMRVLPAFYGPRGSQLDQVWFERQARGDLRNDLIANLDWIAGWRRRRHQRFLSECCDLPAESTTTFVPAVAQAVVAAQAVSDMPRQSRWK